MSPQPFAPAGTSTWRFGSARFQIFFVGQCVSLLGDGLTLLAIPLLVLRLTDDPVMAALAAMPRIIGYLLVGLPAGALVDRLDPRRVMLVADTVRGVLFAGMAVLFAMDQLTVAVLLGGAFVAAAAGVLFETALAVAVRDVLTDEDLPKGNARFEVANQLAILCGPALLGLLASVGGLAFALSVNAATFAVSFLTLVVTRFPTQTRSELTGLRRAFATLATDLREGVRFLLRHRLLRAVVLLQAVTNLLFGAETLLVFFLQHTLALSPIKIGAVIVAGGIGGMIGAAMAGALYRRGAPATTAVLAMTAIGVMLAALGFCRNLPGLLVVNLLLGLFTAVAVVLIRTLRQQITPRELLGRVTSSAKMLVLIAYPLGGAAAGGLSSLAGSPRPVFIGAGLLGVAAVLVIWGVTLRPALLIDPLRSPTINQSEAGA